MFDAFSVIFPVSGVKTHIIVPPLVAMVVSFFTSMGGVSGAFLLLPFQMSVLHYTAPSVSATNLVFNIVAIPSGVYRFIRDGRMAWPLTWVVVLGTLPGVFIGYFLRVMYFPDPKTFKLFAGCVLLYIGVRLLFDLSGKQTEQKNRMKELDDKFRQRVADMKQDRRSHLASGIPHEAVITTVSVNFRSVEYTFWGERFSFSTVGMFLLAFVVGVIGGTYGIGGGAIIAPFCVTIFHLPVYTVAGAALMGTLITSVAGVFFYSIPTHTGLSTSPDWLLGSLFGAGGFIGIYLGARFQKYMPQKLIRVLLGLIIVFIAANHIIQYV